MRKKRPPRIHQLGRPDATEFEIGRTTHRVAEVPPMDVTGVRTMTVGTIVWGVAAIALVPFWGTLADSGRGWWLWTAIAGFGLGLMGIEFCRMRRTAIARAETEHPPEPVTATATDDVAAPDDTGSAVTDTPSARPSRPVGSRRKK